MTDLFNPWVKAILNLILISDTAYTNVNQEHIYTFLNKIRELIYSPP